MILYKTPYLSSHLNNTNLIIQNKIFFYKQCKKQQLYSQMIILYLSLMF